MTRKAGKKSAGPLRQRPAAPRQPRARAPAAAAAPRRTWSDRAAALDYLSITLSHPRWLAARWLDRYGFAATEAWLQFNNQPAPLTLRANRLRTDRRSARRIAGGARCPGRARPLRSRRVGRPQGQSPADARSPTPDCFVVQDEASQLVASLVVGAQRASACSTPARRRAERPPPLPPPWTTGASSSPPTSAGRRVDLLAQDRPAVGGPVGEESFRPMPRRCR